MLTLGIKNPCGTATEVQLYRGVSRQLHNEIMQIYLVRDVIEYNKCIVGTFSYVTTVLLSPPRKGGGNKAEKDYQQSWLLFLPYLCFDY